MVNFGTPFLYVSCVCTILAKSRLTLLDSSPEVQGLVTTMQCKNFSPRSKLNENLENMIHFALEKTAKMVHHSPIECNIFSSMRLELNFFEEFLAPNSGVEWDAPIACLIK